MNEYGMINPPPRKRHRVRKAFGVVILVIAAIIIIAIAASSGSNSTSGGGGSAQQSTTPQATTPQATPQGADKVCFAVTGTGQPSISYGSDSDSRDAGGTLGDLGDGNALPWSACMPADRHALYWSLTAQLEGGGDITATVSEKRPDGTEKTLATAHASGGYQVASAEYAGWVGP
jgi:hypothetical protein